VSYITIATDLFDVWGNREFKTMNCDLEVEDASMRIEDLFQYVRPVGWK
jgi:hypothetical protein